MSRIDFNYPTGSRLGLLTAIQNIGGICAFLFSSYISDGFGRRMGVFMGLIIIFVGTILQG
jgi:MFS family permease